MAIPASGPISMSMFNTELGRTSTTANSKLAGGSTVTSDSLFGLAAASGSINTTAPHRMSEWYSYSATPSPLVQYNFSSYLGSWSGTGTTAVNLGTGGSTYNADISGSPSYRGSTCASPDYCGNLNSAGSGYLLVPGTSTLYSSDFTWTVYHYPQSNGTSFYSLMWSEVSTKNFLWAYGNVGNYTSPTAPTYTRLDSPSTVYYSTVSGTEYNGFGGVGGYFQAYHQPIASTLVKSGTSFTQYFYAYGGTFYKGWDVTVSDWSIGSTTQKVAIGARNDGGYIMNQYLYGAEMYTSALSSTQVQSANDKFFQTFSNCC
jgi:hypothetical protein